MPASTQPPSNEEPDIVGLTAVSAHGNSLAARLGDAREIGGFAEETLTVYGSPDGRVLYTRYDDDPLAEGWTRLGTRTLRRDGKALYVTLSSAVLSVLGVDQGDTLEIWASTGRLMFEERE